MKHLLGPLINRKNDLGNGTAAASCNYFVPFNCLGLGLLRLLSQHVQVSGRKQRSQRITKLLESAKNSLLLHGGCEQKRGTSEGR